jgi:hypothetical protein
VGREYNSDKRQPKSYHIACVEMLSILTGRQEDKVILVACLWEIVVNDHLHPFEVHSTSHQIRAYQNPDVAKAKPSAYWRKKIIAIKMCGGENSIHDVKLLQSMGPKVLWT